MTFAACRQALGDLFGDFREVEDELFVVNNRIVRPKGTASAERGWLWDTEESGLRQGIREEIYLLYAINERDEFYVVPSQFVRGALEGTYYQWCIDNSRDGLVDGSAIDPTTLDRDTMRPLSKWPIRHFKNAWRLLGHPSEPVLRKNLSHDDYHERAELLARGYRECDVVTCRRLFKNWKRHAEDHQRGVLDVYGNRIEQVAGAAMLPPDWPVAAPLFDPFGELGEPVV